MIATINTYKSSGKWYDQFQVEIDDTIPCHDTEAIRKAVEQQTHASGLLDEFNFTIDIDDPRPGFLFKRLFINITKQEE